MTAADSPIIVAVEANDESRGIVTRAARLAAQHQVPLHIINVLPPIAEAYADLNFTPFSEHTYQLFEAQRQKQLETLHAQLGGITQAMEAADINCDLQVLEGIPEQVINQHARETGALMIVMGLHNHHGLSRLLGSTTANVLNHAPCDMLAVHPATDAANRIATDSTMETAPHKHVLVAVDASSHCATVLVRATTFVSEAEQYVILSVIQPLTTIYAASHAGKSENLNFNQIQGEIEQQCRQHVTTATANAGLDTHRIRLPLGDVKPQILAEAQDMQADLIVMGTNARGLMARLLLGSTTRGILDRSPCDVYVVHNGADGEHADESIR
ncbi:MAG: universal stress protein [Pseudomonadota bacterium]